VQAQAPTALGDFGMKKRILFGRICLVKKINFDKRNEKHWGQML
jgi:hypothetical protein